MSEKPVRTMDTIKQEYQAKLLALGDGVYRNMVANETHKTSVDTLFTDMKALNNEAFAMQQAEKQAEETPVKATEAEVVVPNV